MLRAATAVEEGETRSKEEKMFFTITQTVLLVVRLAVLVYFTV